MTELPPKGLADEIRRHFDELLAAIDFAIDKNYPARGEYTGEV